MPHSQAYKFEVRLYINIKDGYLPVGFLVWLEDIKHVLPNNDRGSVTLQIVPKLLRSLSRLSLPFCEAIPMLLILSALP
jgi:hypothetical protein